MPILPNKALCCLNLEKLTIAPNLLRMFGQALAERWQAFLGRGADERKSRLPPAAGAAY